jgi:hypothetical protein
MQGKNVAKRRVVLFIAVTLFQQTALEKGISQDAAHRLALALREPVVIDKPAPMRQPMPVL